MHAASDLCRTVGTVVTYTLGMPQDQFAALVTRLEHAADLLRNGGSLLQALARRYYIVYTYATQAAEKHGVKSRRKVNVDDARRITHQILPNIVQALYTGQNVGSVLGGGPRRDAEWAIDRCRSAPVR
ncbi:MAG: hypothetical protein QOJ39_3505 [Candidatus Eremiobacteraeota bacterium]|jgi:hypothetical protein|nr:hypothetical protein [Candidatus Eremiobacteraeota bacterium]